MPTELLVENRAAVYHSVRVPIERQGMQSTLVRLRHIIPEGWKLIAVGERYATPTDWRKEIA